MERTGHSAYQIISTAFCVIVIVSNIISAKMIHLPFLPHFIIPAGLITYPLTFFLADLVTELYGLHRAKIMVYLTFGMSFLSFLLIQMALWFPSPMERNQESFDAILGLNGMILFGSLSAYLVSQTIDIQLYAWFKTCTSPSHLWIRNNGSTLIAQIFDTIIVNTIHLYYGAGMEFSQVLSTMGFSYIYKVGFNIALTPLFYLAVSRNTRKPWMLEENAPQSGLGTFSWQENKA